MQEQKCCYYVQKMFLFQQIRLPDGRCLRQSFPCTAVLQEVWDFTAKQQRDIDNYVFIQVYVIHVIALFVHMLNVLYFQSVIDMDQT